MKVEATHHIDASEPDENGMYEYRYEYDLYTFTDGEAVLVARSYRNEAEAHFLRMEIGWRAETTQPSRLEAALVFPSRRSSPSDREDTDQLA
jgi:hypothetical protein